MEDERGAYPLAGATALEHLTGPSRGTVTWLSGSTLDISLRTNRFLRVSEARPDEPRHDLVARLHRAEDTYEIEALEGRPVWVNGVRVTAQKLEHRDMIEFGEIGMCLSGARREAAPVRSSQRRRQNLGPRAPGHR